MYWWPGIEVYIIGRLRYDPRSRSCILKPPFPESNIVWGERYLPPKLFNEKEMCVTRCHRQERLRSGRYKSGSDLHPLVRPLPSSLLSFYVFLHLYKREISFGRKKRLFQGPVGLKTRPHTNVDDDGVLVLEEKSSSV